MRFFAIGVLAGLLPHVAIAQSSPQSPAPPATTAPNQPSTPQGTNPSGVNVAPTPTPPTANGEPITTLPPVTVIAPTPLLGSGVDRNKVPSQNQVLTDHDITLQGPPDYLQALQNQAQGVHLDSAAGGPFQPNLFYHGFQAAPLQGTPQGLAVYLNGVRFNQAFGDTVNFDLIPSIAIDRMNLEGANPVFGLNALGGSLAI